MEMEHDLAGGSLFFVIVLAQRKLFFLLDKFA